MITREVKFTRKTKETEISIRLDLDKPADEVRIETTVPFFDHLLHAMTFHGGFSLFIQAKGDTEVDPHHLVEDTGLVFGESLFLTLEKQSSIKRFGHSVIPMDEALAEITVDVCGRPTLYYCANYPQNWAGEFDLALIHEFLTALMSKARISLHAEVRRGENGHHMAEALFKALGKTIKQAYSRNGGIPSTKGTLTV